MCGVCVHVCARVLACVLWVCVCGSVCVCLGCTLFGKFIRRQKYAEIKQY